MPSRPTAPHTVDEIRGAGAPPLVFTAPPLTTSGSKQPSGSLESKVDTLGCGLPARGWTQEELTPALDAAWGIWGRVCSMLTPQASQTQEAELALLTSYPA